ENRAIEVNVLPAGQFWVESGADFQQARDAAAQCDSAQGGLGDPREDLKQGAFAGAIAADYAEYLALMDLEADIVEGPEILDGAALHHLPSPDDVDRPARGVA